MTFFFSFVQVAAVMLLLCLFWMHSMETRKVSHSDAVGAPAAVSGTGAVHNCSTPGYSEQG